MSQKLAQISSQQISATFSLDFTRGRNLDLIKTYGWNHDKRLGVGIIDARSIWQIRTDKVLPLLSEIKTLIPNISIQPSASLQFVPYDAKREKQLPEQLRNVLSFAEQKLQEVRFLARTIGGENSRIEQDLTEELIDTNWEAFTQFSPANTSVQEKLKTKASLYKAFTPAEARRILDKLEFHYTPKHGSWLNMAEIELSVLTRQCLDRRISDKDLLIEEVAAWEQQRNQTSSPVDWRFTTEDARIKLKRLYPSIPS